MTPSEITEGVDVRSVVDGNKGTVFEVDHMAGTFTAEWENGTRSEELINDGGQGWTLC